MGSAGTRKAESSVVAGRLAEPSRVVNLGRNALYAVTSPRAHMNGGTHPTSDLDLRPEKGVERTGSEAVTPC
jgi:hypothetical protein